MAMKKPAARDAAGSLRSQFDDIDFCPDNPGVVKLSDFSTQGNRVKKFVTKG
jgi:hypothetical protein